jgi:hypothetical protein
LMERGMVQAIDQGALEGASDGTSNGSGSDRWCKQ